jgi:hypothetical protein
MSYTPNIIRKLKLPSFFCQKVWYTFRKDDRLQDNSDLFLYAKKIKFYAGELFPDFYVNKIFLTNMKNAIRNKCQVEGIFGPALYVESIEFIKYAFSKKNFVKLYKRSYRDPNHFKIMQYEDGKILSVEDEPHKIDDKDEKRVSRLLFKGYSDKITALLRKFNEERNNAVLITIDNILEEFINSEYKNGEYYGFITRNNDGRVKNASQKQIENFANELNILDKYSKLKVMLAEKKKK